MIPLTRNQNRSTTLKLSFLETTPIQNEINQDTRASTYHLLYPPKFTQVDFTGVILKAWKSN